MSTPLFDDGTSALVPVPEHAAPDESPLDLDGPSCRVCGVALDYAGRGRKPVYCDEHRKSSRAKTTALPSSRRADSSDKLASQAATVLCNVNGFVSLAVMAAGLPQTSEAITVARDGFYIQAKEALVTDPDLCKQILRTGGLSAKVSLILAYGMMAGVVGPVAALEIRVKREERRALATDNDNDE